MAINPYAPPQVESLSTSVLGIPFPLRLLRFLGLGLWGGGCYLVAVWSINGPDYVLHPDIIVPTLLCGMAVAGSEILYVATIPQLNVLRRVIFSGLTMIVSGLAVGVLFAILGIHRFRSAPPGDLSSLQPLIVLVPFGMGLWAARRELLRRRREEPSQ